MGSRKCKTRPEEGCTDREVENAYCTRCTSKVTSPYLRQRATRLMYCGTKCLSDGIRTTVVRAVHGDSSGVSGAAWLWPIKKT